MSTSCKFFPEFTDTDADFQVLGRRIATLKPYGLLRNRGPVETYSLHFGLGDRVVRCGRLTDMRRVLSFTWGEPFVLNYSGSDILPESALTSEQKAIMGRLFAQFQREVGLN